MSFAEIIPVSLSLFSLQIIFQSQQERHKNNAYGRGPRVVVVDFNRYFPFGYVSLFPKHIFRILEK